MTIEAMKQALEALDSDNPDIQLRAATALRAAIEQAEKQEPNEDYERGFVDGMQEQMKRSVDRAVNAMCKREETPFVWYHPVSGRFRFDGDKLPPSWIPLYK